MAFFGDFTMHFWGFEDSGLCRGTGDRKPRVQSIPAKFSEHPFQQVCSSFASTATCMKSSPASISQEFEGIWLGECLRGRTTTHASKKQLGSQSLLRRQRGNDLLDTPIPLRGRTPTPPDGPDSTS